MNQARRMSTRVAFLGVAGLLLVSVASAQGIRGDLRIVGSYIEYRGLVRETVPESTVAGDGITRKLPDGTIVTCIPGGDCYYYRPDEVTSTTPVTEDLRFTAWPGWQGVSARVHLRGRMGSDAFWPQSSAKTQALNAYVEVDRERFRVRAGRQDKGGGLGVHYFDGGDVVWKAAGPFRLEAFGGRSLDRSAVQPRTGSLLSDVDVLAPDKPAFLVGAEARVRLAREFNGSLLYQREEMTDNAGVCSQRMALEASWIRRPVSVDIASNYDLVFSRFNAARVRLSGPISRRVDLAAEVRRYRPWFESWTIWGVFNPVGYGEGKLEAHWAAAPGLQLQLGGAYRDYDETEAGADFLPIDGDGWRALAGANWTRNEWSASARLNVHRGFGAYRSSLDISAGRQMGPDAWLGVYGLGTQQFTEFRFGDGSSRGAGVEGRWSRGRIGVDGTVGLYRHSIDNSPAFDDYTQIRGRLGLTVGFGAEAVTAQPGRGKERS